MNALKILAGLLELPKVERDMIVKLATREPSQQVHRKVIKTDIGCKNGQKQYTHEERVWLNEHFKSNPGDTNKTIAEAMKELGRSYDAIQRKLEDFACNRSSKGTWADWVKGGK